MKEKTNHVFESYNFIDDKKSRTGETIFANSIILLNKRELKPEAYQFNTFEE